MKILRAIARLNVGGPARHVVLLDRGLRARGHETLLVHGAVGPGEASLERLAADARLRVVKIAELGPRMNALSDIRAFFSLLRLTFRERPDVIHSHTAKAGALARASALVYNATRARGQRALVVHTFHGHVLEGYFSPAATALIRIVERMLARATDCVVTISARQRDDIVRRFRIAPDARVVTIPLGLDLDPLLNLPESASADARRALGLAASDIVLGYAGRFVPIKDLPTLVAAFASVAKEHPHAVLVLAGDGPLRGDIESRARALGVADRVRWLGWTDDLAELYSAIDICVLSSLNEGTPVAAIEAMAAGKPVVATAVGGVPDVVEEGRSGMLVPPRDPAALARALSMLITDVDRRLQLGREARAYARSRFSYVRLVDDIDRLYRDRLLQRRGTIPTAR